MRATPYQTKFAPQSLPRIALFLVLGILTASRTVQPQNQNPLLGAWHLLWLEQPGPGGTLQRPSCTGQFLFTPDGHFSVQVMYSAASESAAPENYARAGYEATFGRYAIDSGSHNLSLHVEGSLVPALVGKDLPRTYEISGNQMIVKSANPPERWRVAWQRD
jgi:hypothetical protein